VRWRGPPVLRNLGELRDADTASHLADATTYLTVLERLYAGDSNDAANILKKELSAAEIGLSANRDRLSHTQSKQLSAIQQRISRLEATKRPLGSWRRPAAVNIVTLLRFTRKWPGRALPCQKCRFRDGWHAELYSLSPSGVCWLPSGQGTLTSVC
jgi:hypothetical protein